MGRLSPGSDTHRGRIRVEVIRGDDDGKEGVQLVLAQKPSKNDPAGERRFEKGS